VVGRPNVGKSTLVNRILRRRAAVVEEKPGVTRDRKEFAADWAGRRFLLVDTGGWVVKGDDLVAAIRHQAHAAVSGADVIVFVADATTPPTEDDLAVARLVQSSRLSR
jgi:GTP-binding protein